MSARTGFTASDAERQAAESSSNYLNRALLIVAEQCGRTTTYRQNPAAIAAEFPAVICALIEAQSREYLAWVLSNGLNEIASPLAAASHDLGALISRRFDSCESGKP
jgi:hypothetical protein